MGADENARCAAALGRFSTVQGERTASNGRSLGAIIDCSTLKQYSSESKSAPPQKGPLVRFEGKFCARISGPRQPSGSTTRRKLQMPGWCDRRELRSKHVRNTDRRQEHGGDPNNRRAQRDHQAVPLHDETVNQEVPGLPRPQKATQHEKHRRRRKSSDGASVPFMCISGELRLVFLLKQQ